MSSSAAVRAPAARELAVAASSAAVALALLGLAAGPAAATGSVRHSTAPLLDSHGADSGCIVRTPDLRLHVSHDGGIRLVRSHRLLCSQDWGWRVWTVGLFELKPDGSRVTLEPMTRAVAGSGPTAGVPDVWRAAEPCSDYPGTHTFVARADVKVKAVQGDDHPYSAVVEKATTLTCPSG